MYKSGLTVYLLAPKVDILHYEHDSGCPAQTIRVPYSAMSMWKSTTCFTARCSADIKFETWYRMSDRQSGATAHTAASYAFRDAAQCGRGEICSKVHENRIYVVVQSKSKCAKYNTLVTNSAQAAWRNASIWSLGVQARTW